MKLAQGLVSRIPGRTLAEVRFYTGVPSESQNANWHGFWNNKLRHFQRQGVRVYRQELSAAGQKKGVDVRLVVELVQATYEQLYDVAIIVSQDADLAPAVVVAREIARGQNRSLGLESAFPQVPAMTAPSRATTTLAAQQQPLSCCVGTTPWNPKRISPARSATS